MNKSIETSRSLPYEKTTKQSMTANRKNEIKSFSTEMVPLKLSASFTQQVEMSTTSQPVSADTDNVWTGTISDLNDNFETTMAENKMTTLPVVSENTLGTDETMDLKNNNLHNYTSVGMLETTFMTYTTQSVKDVENTEKVSSGQAQAIEKTVSTTVDINSPLSSAKEGAGGLEKTPSDDQTTTETTEQLHGEMTSTVYNTEKMVPSTNQTTVQGKSYKSFLDTVKDKQKSLYESLSNDSNVFESTTAFTNISEHANDQTVADVPLELEFVTNPLSVSSDTNSIATSSSTVATSILHVDSSALSSDVLEHPVTKPLTVCQCGTQHDSVPQLPSGYHIYPGTVFTFLSNSLLYVLATI